jgi:hypothetical protein
MNYQQILIKSAYSKITTRLVQYASVGYCKMIFDDQGKKYQINVYGYNYNGEMEYEAVSFFKNPEGLDFEVKFLLTCEKNHFTMENFFEDIWKNMKCLYYEKIIL